MLKKLLRKDVYNKIWQSSVKEVAQKYNVDYDLSGTTFDAPRM